MQYNTFKEFPTTQTPHADSLHHPMYSFRRQELLDHPDHVEILGGQNLILYGKHQKLTIEHALQLADDCNGYYEILRYETDDQLLNILKDNVVFETMIVLGVPAKDLTRLCQETAKFKKVVFVFCVDDISTDVDLLMDLNAIESVRKVTKVQVRRFYISRLMSLIRERAIRQLYEEGFCQAAFHGEVRAKMLHMYNTWIPSMIRKYRKDAQITNINKYQRVV